MTGAKWWLEPPHRWLANREAERAASDALVHLGQGDLVYSLSGGGDSTATYLYGLESGLNDAWEKAGGTVRRVFMDTGWETEETYDYIDRLEDAFGAVDRITTWVPGPNEAPPAGYALLENVWKAPGKTMEADRHALALLFEARLGRYCPMIRLILHWGKFPTSVRKWCTADLKLRPVIAYLAALDNPVNIIGVRAEESAKRAAQPAWEWAEDYDAWIWRPIKWWSKQDRIDIHTRFGWRPNPLYLRGTGARRVGCRVCVNSGKEDILWIEEEIPDSLGILADLEDVLSTLETPRELPGAGSPRWFTLSRDNEDWMVSVAEAVTWAHTERGGRQMSLFKPHKDPGCSAWGLCEVNLERE